MSQYTHNVQPQPHSANKYTQNHFGGNESAPAYSAPSPVDFDKKNILEKAPSNYQDVWAAVFYLANFVCFLALTVYLFTFIKFRDGKLDLDEKDKLLEMTFIKLAGVSSAIAVSFAICFFMLAFLFPTQMITGCFIASALSSVVFAGYLISQGYAIKTSCYTIIFGVISLIWLFVVRSRIKFSGILLKYTIGIMSKYKQALLLPLMSLLLSVFIHIVTILALVGNYERSVAIKNSVVSYLISLFIVFFYFWSMQVVKNISHVTISGLYAAHYFFHGSGQDNRNPTIRSLRRACTWSFGSICLGSLLVAIVETIKAIADSADSDDGGFVAACLSCILALLRDLFDMFNRNL